MTNVVLSPNVKKTSARIDLHGNILNKQGQVLEAPEIPYQPTSEELKRAVQKEIPIEIPSNNLSDKISKMIEQKVNQKIDELVAKKVEEALSKL